jgi:hypothetical protein
MMINCQRVFDREGFHRSRIAERHTNTPMQRGEIAPRPARIHPAILPTFSSALRSFADWSGAVTRGPSRPGGGARSVSQCRHRAWCSGNARMSARHYRRACRNWSGRARDLDITRWSRCFSTSRAVPTQAARPARAGGWTPVPVISRAAWGRPSSLA